MLTGIKLRANPTSHQKLILSQWMGCARSIWNAKVEEERYYRTYARKYCTIGTYAPYSALWPVSQRENVLIADVAGRSDGQAR